jgi:hypothetical protein
MNTSNPWQDVHANIGDLLWSLDEDSIESLEIQQGRGFALSKPLLRTLPKPPNSSRYYFKKLQRQRSQTSEFQQVLIECDRLLLNAFNNNDYLLALRGINITEQIADLSKQGIRITLPSVKAIKEGKHKSVNLVLPTALAVYHGEPLIRFLTQDYAAQKLAPYRPTAPRDTRLTFDRLPSELRRTYALAETPVK